MLKELIEKRARLHEENVALLDKVRKDGRDTLNGDEETEWEARDKAIEALTRNITMREKQEAIEKTLAAVAPAKAERGEPTAPERATSATALRNLKRGQADLDLALRAWFLRGRARPEHIEAANRLGFNLNSPEITFNLSVRAPRRADLTDYEFRDQALNPPAAGGYTVPDEMMRAIEKALLWYGGMRQAANVIRTGTGADLPWPTVNDTTNKGVILNENTQVAQQDVAFNQMVLKAFKYSSKEVRVSVELMQDSATDLGALLGELLGERIGRIQNEHFTVGLGTTTPWGIVTRATQGVAPAGSVAAGFKYVDFVDLEHSVDVSYRQQGAAFMLHDLSYARIKKVVDTDGRPLISPAGTGLAEGAGMRLLGYPLIINNDMAGGTPINNMRAVLFGALNKYMIREVLGVTLMRLDERYADFHQVAFLAFARADGDLLNAGTNPVKFLAYAT